MKFYNKLFFLLVVTGSILVISSSSWLMMWVGLEINLLSIIPLMNKSKSILMTEASLKYFLVQALASSLFLMSIISMSISLLTWCMIPLYTALLMKIGAAPLHFWVPMVCEGLEWNMVFVVLTWQKIAPFIILFYTFHSYEVLIILFIMSSSLIGALGGLNQSNLNKIMAYSSINHLSWMLMSLFLSVTFWTMYFLTYTFMLFSMITMFNSFNWHYLNQLTLSTNSTLTKFMFFMNLLSLGGLPPFLGFFPKWILIQALSNSFFLLLIFLLVCTIITLNYYLRLTLFAFTLNSIDTNWFKLNESSVIHKLFSFLSTSGLLIILIFFTGF